MMPTSFACCVISAGRSTRHQADATRGRFGLSQDKMRFSAKSAPRCRVPFVDLLVRATDQPQGVVLLLAVMAARCVDQILDCELCTLR